MICTAGTLARRVTRTAVVDAVCGCCGALIIWDGLGVFGGIGLLAVAAYTGIVEGALGLDN